MSSKKYSSMKSSSMKNVKICYRITKDVVVVCDNGKYYKYNEVTKERTMISKTEYKVGKFLTDNSSITPAGILKAGLGLAALGLAVHYGRKNPTIVAQKDKLLKAMVDMKMPDIFKKKSSGIVKIKGPFMMK